MWRAATDAAHGAPRRVRQSDGGLACDAGADSGADADASSGRGVRADPEP